METKDRFLDIPRDILEIILYETKIEDLDTFCSINLRIDDLCQDDRVMDKYITQYGLKSEDLRKTITNIINTNSITLIKYFIESIKKRPIAQERLFLFITNLLANKNISNQDIAFLIYFLPQTYEIFNILTNRALLNNRHRLIKFLKEADIFDYRQSLESSIKMGNIEEFINTLNYIIDRNFYDNYNRFFDISHILDWLIQNPNVQIVRYLLSIENPTFRNKLIQNLPGFINQIQTYLNRSYNIHYNDQYRAILSLFHGSPQ